jgi:ABC-type lipoprotein release transport system permease subunit
MPEWDTFKKGRLNTLRVGWFLAVEQLRRASRGTTGLIIFIMVLTFLNLVVVSGLLVGLISGSFGAYREGYSGEMIVTSAAGRDHIEHSQEFVNFLDTHPKVKVASPRYSIGSTILGTLDRNPGNNERPNQIQIMLTGIDVNKEERTTGFSRFVIKGRNLNPGETDGILIGANMIKKYSSFADANIPGLDFLKNVDIGSRVRVTIAGADGKKVVKDYYLRGILKSKIDQISTRAFVTAGELKRLLPSDKGEYQEIAVRTDPLYAPTLVAQSKSFLGPESARIQTSDESIPSFLRDIESTMGLLGNALSSIALVVASITVFIVIYINAVTKRKYIGIMKGIGINPQSILFSYVVQALFYGLVGSAIGLVLTFGFLKPYFNAHPINFPFSDGILVATFTGAFLRVAILLVVTLLAGYIPARLIIRRNALDAILGR